MVEITGNPKYLYQNVTIENKDFPNTTYNSVCGKKTLCVRRKNVYFTGLWSYCSPKVSCRIRNGCRACCCFNDHHNASQVAKRNESIVAHTQHTSPSYVPSSNLKSGVYSEGRLGFGGVGGGGGAEGDAGG